MTSVIANPLSIKKIRELANMLREATNYNDTAFFPVVHFIESILPSIDSEFSLVIEDINSMGACHGLACPEEKCIKLREDVYERAIQGIGRDRFTVAHELGHYLLHDDNNVTLARMEKNKKIEHFRDPEWQANTFAAELLVPLNLIDTQNIYEIAENFGVSNQVAEIRLNKLIKQQLMLLK